MDRTTKGGVHQLNLLLKFVQSEGNSGCMTRWGGRWEGERGGGGDHILTWTPELNEIQVSPSDSEPLMYS